MGEMGWYKCCTAEGEDGGRNLGASTYGGFKFIRNIFQTDSVGSKFQIKGGANVMREIIVGKFPDDALGHGGFNYGLWGTAVEP
jgi:hypothetical protein